LVSALETEILGKRLPNLALNFNLRRYTKVQYDDGDVEVLDLINGGEKVMLVSRVDGRGLNSFTFQLNVSAFCGTGGAL